MELIKMAKVEEVIKSLKIENGFDVTIDGIKHHIKEHKDIDSKSVSYKFPTHKKTWNEFYSLVTSYRECLDDYKKCILPDLINKKSYTVDGKSLETPYFEYVYNMLKKMEDSDEDKINNASLFLSSQIQKEINSFRKIKQELAEEIKNLKGQLDKVKIFNFKKRMEIKSDLIKAEKAIRNFKDARRDIKVTARIGKTITSSTYVHSVLNYTNSKDKKTFTGIVGDITSMSDFIEENKSKDKCKKFKPKEIKEIKKQRLKGGSKSYDSCKSVYEIGKDLCKRFCEQNNSNVTARSMIESINSLKNEMDGFLAAQLDLFNSRMTTVKIQKMVKKLRESFNKQKKIWIDRYEGNFDKEEAQLGTFIDVYYQTKSLAIFKQSDKNDAGGAVILFVTIGLNCIVNSIAIMLVCPPVGSFLMGVGIGLLYSAFFIAIYTRDFDENKRLFSKAQAKVENERKKVKKLEE